MIRIEGILRLTHPLHCAAGSDKVNGRNVTFTTTQPLVGRNGIDSIPYFPGNDLRGRLRRFAARKVLDHIVSDTTKISRELFSGLMSGSESASPDTSSLTVEEAFRGRNHVYMGVFGGGARILRSGYRVSDLLPVTEATIDAGSVPRHLGAETDDTFTPVTYRDGNKTPAAGWQLIQEYNIIRVDDVFRVMNTGDLEKYLANAAETVTNYQLGVKANQKARVEEEAKKSDVGNMVSFRAIAAGTPMYFRLDMQEYLSDAQVGLLVEALRALINEQALGGWVRAGLGQFTANLSITRDGGTQKLFERDENGHYQVMGEAKNWVEAAELALANVSAAELEAFYRPRKEAEAVK